MSSNDWLGIGLVLLIGQGVYYLGYHVYRETCLDEAQSDRGSPASAFMSTFLFGIFFWPFVIALIPLTGCLFGPYWFFPAIAVVFFGLRGWLKLNKEYRQYASARLWLRDNHPIPKLQFRIYDLLLGAFTFGVMMMALTTNLFAEKFTTPMFKGVVSTLIVFEETIAFLVVMDICRRSESLQRPWSRAIYLMIIMVLAAVPPVFAVMLVTWQVWRYALWKTQSWRFLLWQKKEKPPQTSPVLTSESGGHDATLD